MEGTLIGEGLDELTPPETEIEKQMANLCRETKGAVFVSVPSMSIDRIVTIYRGARQTGTASYLYFMPWQSESARGLGLCTPQGDEKNSKQKR